MDCEWKGWCLHHQPLTASYVLSTVQGADTKLRLVRTAQPSCSYTATAYTSKGANADKRAHSPSAGIAPPEKPPTVTGSAALLTGEHRNRKLPQGLFKGQYFHLFMSSSVLFISLFAITTALLPEVAQLLLIFIFIICILATDTFNQSQNGC